MIYFLCDNCNVEVLSSPSLFENLVGSSTPLQKRRDAHYVGPLQVSKYIKTVKKCAWVFKEYNIYWKKSFSNFLSDNFLASKWSPTWKTACIRAYPCFSTSFLGATRNSICSRKYVIWRFISTPTPLFQERHENFYGNFLPLS